jgi:hypothetical protein
LIIIRYNIIDALIDYYLGPQSPHARVKRIDLFADKKNIPQLSGLNAFCFPLCT